MKDEKLVGIFENENEVIRVIKNLKTAGYDDKEISVVSKYKGKVHRIDDVADVSTQATDETISEESSGMIVVGGAGASLFEFGGEPTVPGSGPFMAAGPIATTLTGLGKDGRVGGIAAVLVDLGITKSDAKDYEKYLDKGDILVAVNKKDNIDKDLILGYYLNSKSRIKNEYNYDNKD